VFDENLGGIGGDVKENFDQMIISWRRFVPAGAAWEDGALNFACRGRRPQRGALFAKGAAMDL
jgi:hypothetical protein